MDFGSLAFPSTSAGTTSDNEIDLRQVQAGLLAATFKTWCLDKILRST